MTATAAAPLRTDPTADRNAALVAVYKLLHQYSRRRVAHFEDAEDLAHDAAVLFLEQFKPERSGSRAARNAFARMMVRTAHFRRINSRAAKVVTVPDSVAAVTAKPADGATERDVARLDAALNRLSPAVRELLVGRFGIGVPAKPLTELHGGLSRQAAHARATSVLKKFRRVMLAIPDDEF